MKHLGGTTLIAALAERCALSWRAASIAETAILHALAAALPPVALAHLGDLFATGRPAREPVHEPTLRGLIDEIVAATGVSPSAAVEQLNVLCSEIATAWADDDRRAVLAATSPEVGALFTPAANADARSPQPHDHARHTLSSGQPGAAHPIASAPASDGAHTLATGRAPTGR